MTIIIISSLIFAKLIGRELQQVNADLQDDDCEILTVKGRFRNIFLMHQEMGEYMNRIERITFRTYFTQIGTAFIGAIACLYGMLTVNYMPINCCIALLIFQIFIACLLGNCVQLTHDQIYDSALELDWNELHIREQFYYKFFISRCQTPKLLTIGGLAPLNLNSCVKIFGRIYTITMLLYTILQ
ncbi:putative odorant receptor 83c [Sitodiplosis mosellana]|uniref:putative odorant receptor 83c n=1 Tax=Sitodiplosis mosellana TaxID=263140 RepID=UPI002444A2AB|nr:putative odorant receptor 83c [Sitodiplosis mosellana]